MTHSSSLILLSGILQFPVTALEDFSLTLSLSGERAEAGELSWREPPQHFPRNQTVDTQENAQAAERVKQT